MASEVNEFGCNDILNALGSLRNWLLTIFRTASDDVDGFGYNDILNGRGKQWMASEVDGFGYNKI